MAMNLYQGEKIALAGAGAAALGVFLPWLTATAFGTTMTMRGIDGDGVFALIAAAVVGANIIWGNWSRTNQRLVVIFGLIIAGIGLYYLMNPLAGANFQSLQQEQLAQAFVQPGMGLYLTAAGGVAAAAGGGMGLSENPVAQSEYRPMP